MIDFKQLDYGFKYGDASVQRLASDKKKGWIVLELETSKQAFQIYVTKKGKVKITEISKNQLQ